MYTRFAWSISRSRISTTPLCRRDARQLSSSTPNQSSEFNSKRILKVVFGITDVRFLIVFPLVLVVCVASAYYDAKKELEKEPPPFKELPGGRIMLQDGSIVKAPR